MARSDVRDRVHVLLMLFGAIVLVVCACVFVTECADCQQRGGAYVRDGAGFYVCVERKP